ncbi:CHAD domain-containing protein [Maricaulis sp. CAU 1757]
MTEKLRPDETLADLPRIIGAEIDHALGALDRVPQSPITALRDARSNTLKARAMVRLLALAQPARARAFNMEARIASHTLGKICDLDRLRGMARTQLMACDQSCATAGLEDELARLRRDAKAADRASAASRARRALHAMRGELDDWPGLARADEMMQSSLVERRARIGRHLQSCRADPHPAALDALRKRVKDWQYQCVALKHLWPDNLPRRKRKARRLAKLLTRYRDMNRLQRRLEAGAVEASAGAELWDGKLDELRRQSLALAERTFGDPT